MLHGASTFDYINPSTIAALAITSEQVIASGLAPSHHLRNTTRDISCSILIFSMLVVPFLVPAFDIAETGYRISRSRLQIAVDATQTQCRNTTDSILQRVSILSTRQKQHYSFHMCTKSEAVMRFVVHGRSPPCTLPNSKL